MGYVGYTLLFMIPVIGWIFLLVFTFSSGNINRRCYVRSFWCTLLLAVLLAVGGSILAANSDELIEMASEGLSALTDTISDISVEETRRTERPTALPPSVTDAQTDKPVSVTKAPTQVPTTESPTAKPTATPTAKPAVDAQGVTIEFKEVMEGYEAFFDEYIDFMNKYEESNNDIAMLADYLSIMNRYAKTMKELEDIGDQELSEADAWYYLQVSNRINKKMLESLQ